MSSDLYSRRQVLAGGATATAALALGGTLRAEAATAASASAAPTPTFYDPRFPVSRLRARALPGRPELHPIQGDPTALLALVAEARAGGVRRLQGVTTDSIPFCLKEFAGRGPGVRLECRRMDRDLFTWTLTLGVATPESST